MARTCRGLTAPTTSAPRHWNAESGQQQDLTPKGSERPRRSANVGVTCGAHTSDGAVRRGILARRSTGVRGQSRGRGLSRANDFFRGVSSHAPSVKRRAMVAPTAPPTSRGDAGIRRSVHAAVNPPSVTFPPPVTLPRSQKFQKAFRKERLEARRRRAARFASRLRAGWVR